MLAAVKGYYDGAQIIVDEEDKKSLRVGDELIITILDKINFQKTETRAERRRRIIAANTYVSETGRTVEEVDKDEELGIETTYITIKKDT